MTGQKKKSGWKTAKSRKTGLLYYYHDHPEIQSTYLRPEYYDSSEESVGSYAGSVCSNDSNLSAVSDEQSTDKQSTSKEKVVSEDESDQLSKALARIKQLEKDAKKQKNKSPRSNSPERTPVSKLLSFAKDIKLPSDRSKRVGDDSINSQCSLNKKPRSTSHSCSPQSTSVSSLSQPDARHRRRSEDRPNDRSMNDAATVAVRNGRKEQQPSSRSRIRRNDRSMSQPHTHVARMPTSQEQQDRNSDPQHSNRSRHSDPQHSNRSRHRRNDGFMNTARMRTREQQQCRLAKNLRNRNKKNRIRYHRKLAKTNKSYTSSPEVDDGDKKLPAKKSVPTSPKRGDKPPPSPQSPPNTPRSHTTSTTLPAIVDLTLPKESKCTDSEKDIKALKSSSDSPQQSPPPFTIHFTKNSHLFTPIARQ